MNLLDWTVIILYLSVLLTAASVFSRKQRSINDYYTTSGNMRWWQAGTSSMATQLGAISFVSAPAFVAIKENGGLKWLCYELGVPLGLVVVMVVLVPVLYKKNVISIYEYLEERFDRATRTLVSLLFQLGRALATAVAVLAGGIIISTCTPLSTVAAICLMGFATIIYDALGGIKIVIVSDVMQMCIIVCGIMVCLVAALQIVGWQEAWAATDAARFKILDFSHTGITPQGEYSFWPMFLGGIFLYASYYGCDQSQMQRLLTVSSQKEARKSILLNGLGRFPVVLIYCLMGIIIGAVVMQPGFIDKAAVLLNTDAQGVETVLASDPDRMVPLFILAYLPHGIIGFLFVSIISALMSSLDSAINSLSAATMRDIYQPYVKPDGSRRHYFLMSKLFTVLWGLFCTGGALVFAGAHEAVRQTTIVLINAVGSLLYGPILASFLLGILVKGITGKAVRSGIICGISLNLALWLFTDVSWLWWNVTGCAATLVCASAVAGFDRQIHRGYSGAVSKTVLKDSAVVTLGAYTFLIIGICFLIQTMR